MNDIFPKVALSKNDIESGWVGLRPLIQKPGKGPSEISRKDELFISDSGLITIAGGKLTGYRKMAQHVVDLISKKLKQSERKNIPACSTEHVALSGGKVGGAAKFADFAKIKRVRCSQLGLTITEAEIIINRFGSNVDKVLDKIETLKTEQSTLPLLLRAQLHYSMEEEMCVTPSDFFVRRIGAMYFDIDTVKNHEKELLIYMQKIFDWDEKLTSKFDAELKTNKFNI